MTTNAARSFVVARPKNEAFFWFGLPILGTFGVFGIGLLPPSNAFDYLIFGFWCVNTILFPAVGFVLRRPIVVDRKGVWQSRIGWPTKYLIPWADIESSVPVLWKRGEDLCQGVLIAVSASSAWPDSIGETTRDITEHLSNFLDPPLPDNPALITAHGCEFDTMELSDFISRHAASEKLRESLETVVNTHATAR
jgi:hypothetical protein